MTDLTLLLRVLGHLRQARFTEWAYVTAPRLLHLAFSTYVNYVSIAVWSHKTSDSSLFQHWFFLGSTTITYTHRTACHCPCTTSEGVECSYPLHCRFTSTLPCDISPVFSALAPNLSAYTIQTVFLCMVLLTGMHQTTSPIWLHWHQLRWAGHIFALPTASPLTSLRRERGWTIVHSLWLVRVPGTHFLLTFVVLPACMDTF